MRVLIVGCGYTGIPLGRRLLQRGHEVYGMRRSTNARTELENAGINFLHGDISDAASLARLDPHFDWVVNLVSSTRGGAAEYQSVYVQGNQNLLHWLAPSPPRMLLYTSSTSVYAQTDGSIVTEESPATGSSPTSRLLVHAEKILLDAALDRNFPALVLRVAGIYGPGRGHLYQQFVLGQAKMIGDGSRLLNMIHLDDLVDAISAAFLHGKPGEIYNLVDDLPVTEKDFFTWLSLRLFKPLPPPATPEQVAARKRGFTSKRVSNEKLKAHFGFWFLYPTFREGYEKLIQEDFAQGAFTPPRI